jgi:V/A-type H+-transporting ATPase subunit A
VDFAFLQQDAFDAIDALCPLERQKFMLDLILALCDRHYEFETFEECRAYFKDLINTLRQMNYTQFQSPEFNAYEQQLRKHLA